MESTTLAPTEQGEQVQTWECENADCNAWTRTNFVTEASPKCPLCSGTMIPGQRVLPVVTNKFKKKFIVGKRRYM